MRDTLLLKHPEPHVPPVSALPCCVTLSLFEDVEISGAHVQAIAVGFEVVLVLKL